PLAVFPKCYIDELCVKHSLSVDQWIDLSAQFDVDGLEFYWEFTPRNRPAEWERLRRRVEQQGRSIPMFCYSPDFTQPGKDERKLEVDRQKEAIRTAAGLGAKYCRVLSGQRRPGVSRNQGLRWASECILEALPCA